MATSMQPGLRVRNGDRPTQKRRTRWSQLAAREAGTTAGYLEKQLYGPDPIHRRLRAMIRAAIKVGDHGTLARLLDGIEADVIDGAEATLASQAAYIRRIREALSR